VQNLLQEAEGNLIEVQLPDIGVEGSDEQGKDGDDSADRQCNAKDGAEQKCQNQVDGNMRFKAATHLTPARFDGVVGQGKGAVGICLEFRAASMLKLIVAIVGFNRHSATAN